MIRSKTVASIMFGAFVLSEYTLQYNCLLLMLVLMQNIDSAQVIFLPVAIN